MKRSTTFLICAILIYFYSACSNDTNDITDPVDPIISEALYFPPNGSSEWTSTSMTSLGWNISAFNDLKNFLSASNAQAFIILVNGKIVIEEYFNGATNATIIPWFSASKTLTAFTTGLVII